MKNPLVSIIIPCWNAERYVGKAIESALAQTYPNIEVIVIDDGSTDGSLNIIKSYGDEIVWKTFPNAGANAARNRALEISRGELIQFLDSDDVLFPNKLQVMVPLAVEGGHGSIVICDWIVCSETGDVIEEHVVGYKGEDPFCFRLHNSIHTASALHWRDDLRQIGPLDEWLTCSQDLDWHLKLFAKGVKILYVEQDLFSITRKEVSVSSSYTKVMNQHIGQASRLIESGLLSKDQKKALARFIAQDARNYMYFGEVFKSKLYHLAAKEIDEEAALDAFSGIVKALAKITGPFMTDLAWHYLARRIKRLVARGKWHGKDKCCHSLLQ